MRRQLRKWRIAGLFPMFDLAILAATSARFQQYCAQIRFEYAFVPAAIFANKRAQVLRAFLAQEKIYHSPLGVGFEAVARGAIQTEGKWTTD